MNLEGRQMAKKRALAAMAMVVVVGLVPVLAVR